MIWGKATKGGERRNKCWWQPLEKDTKVYGTGPRTSVKELKPKRSWYHTSPDFASLIGVA